MKAIFTALLIAASLTGLAQKDTTKNLDTVYVFHQADIEALKAMIMSSKIVGQDGQQLTGNQIIQLLTWLDSRRIVQPKTAKK